MPALRKLVSWQTRYRLASTYPTITTGVDTDMFGCKQLLRQPAPSRYVIRQVEDLRARVHCRSVFDSFESSLVGKFPLKSTPELDAKAKSQRRSGPHSRLSSVHQVHQPWEAQPSCLPKAVIQLDPAIIVGRAETL